MLNELKGVVDVLRAKARAAATLSPTDLLRDTVYRRLWTSILISAFGGQVSMLALPLTAAVLLQATPTQMGWLLAAELLPFVLFSLPVGVWLDRVLKLPVYVFGEALLGVTLATVPLAWWLGWLNMGWLYAVGFVIGTVHTTAGSAAQIVLTQVVPRERLVEAHAKNSLASSSAEVAGPGVAGALIRLLGAPVALLVDAVMLTISACILRGVQVNEQRHAMAPGEGWQRFKADLIEGLRFVRQQPLLIAMATCVGVWQMCHQAALVVQILFATRTLHMSEQAIGLSYIALGVGTVSASVLGHRISARIGPGPCLILGWFITALGWLLLAVAPVGTLGVWMFGLMLSLFGVGAVLIFINFISLRQAVTPEPMLGRMTSTVRWLILLPAGPGALIGGWLGEHVDLRASLVFSGSVCLVMCLVAWNWPVIRNVKVLPKPQGAVPGTQVVDEATT